MKLRRSVFVLLGVFLVSGGGLAWLLSGARPPTDQSVVDHFRRAKPHLEQLKRMLSDDPSVERVADYGVTTDKSIVSEPPQKVGMTTERYQEYLNLLDLAGAKVAGHRDNEFKFGIAGWGFASKGWRLSLIYRDSPPDPKEIIDSIDGFRPTGSNWRQGYRHLEGDWYAWIIW